MIAAVTFKDEILQRFARIACIITNDRQLHLIVDKFLQDIAGQTRAQSEKIFCYSPFVNNDPLAVVFIIDRRHQVKRRLNVRDQKCFGLDFSDILMNPPDDDVHIESSASVCYIFALSMDSSTSIYVPGRVRSPSGLSAEKMIPALFRAATAVFITFRVCSNQA